MKVVCRCRRVLREVPNDIYVMYGNLLTKITVIKEGTMVKLSQNKYSAVFQIIHLMD